MMMTTTTTPRGATLLGGALLLILTTSVLTGCGSEAPSPTTDATLSASPTTTPSSGLAPPGEVTIDPSLPDALPLPDGIWAETGPGWVLATYRPSIEPWSNEGTSDTTVEPTVQVVYLVSPEGVRYQVLELDPDWTYVIDSWSARESLAYVRTCPGTQACIHDQESTLLLDLTTGESTPSGAPPGANMVTITLPGDTRIWTSNEQFIVSEGDGGTFLEKDGQFTEFGDGWSIASGPSPNGAWMILEHWETSGDTFWIEGGAVASLVTGDMVTIPESPDRFCRLQEWREDGLPILNCPRDHEEDGIHTSESVWFVFDPSTGAMNEIPIPVYSWEEPIVSHDEVVSPGVWAGTYGLGDPEMWDWEPSIGIDDHGTLTKVDILDAEGVSLRSAWVQRAVQGVVYIEAKHTDIDVSGFLNVIAYDPTTGTQIVLLPEPPGGLVVDLADGSFESELWGVTSWVVAP